MWISLVKNIADPALDSHLAHGDAMTGTESLSGNCTQFSQNPLLEAAPGVNWPYCNLEVANLSHANLQGADLSYANLENTHWFEIVCPDGELGQYPRSPIPIP